MKYLRNLKTSNKISVYFSLFNLLSLIILLFSINVIYFFIWYTEIKDDSLYDMNKNYDSYTDHMSDNNKEAFIKYILEKDTIITPNNWTWVICSDWVWLKLHSNEEALEELRRSFFYEIEDKIYFIFSRDYEEIWNVKILYDTTGYFNSQIIIIKVSFFVILISIFLNLVFWKFVSNYLLRDLKRISDYAKNLDINTETTQINILSWKDDEIKILSDTLNRAFNKIKEQSENQQQFITDVSHEFKTPLMVINSMIDLYNKSIEKWKKQDTKDLLNWIKRNTKKLNRLLETLFFLSRLEDSTLFFDKKEVCLLTIIEDITIDLQKSYTWKDIKINLDIPKNYKIFIEKVSFNILIENLIVNAIKFNDNSVVINILLKDNKLEISDNWFWIEKDKLTKIWNKFSRLDKSVEWFWVWLFLVKRIIKLYNWDIKIESEVWKWTKFIIKF